MLLFLRSYHETTQKTNELRMFDTFICFVFSLLVSASEFNGSEFERSNHPRISIKTGSA